MPASDRKIVESLAGNSVCMECGAPGPEWASVTLAIVLCLDCSGRHRGLGTHLSFVRSITMDSWSEKQLQSMKAGGGNEACRKFLSHHGVLVHPPTTGRLNDTYDTPAAELYRQVIKARVEGRPECLSRSGRAGARGSGEEKITPLSAPTPIRLSVHHHHPCKGIGGR